MLFVRIYVGTTVCDFIRAYLLSEHEDIIRFVRDIGLIFEMTSAKT